MAYARGTGVTGLRAQLPLRGEPFRLRRRRDTPLAVVELWDSVEPKAMAEVVASGGLTVTGVITAVAPALLLPYLGNGDDLAEGGLAAAATDRRTVADTFARQLEYAPVLAVLDSPEADDEDRELLAQLHPTARQVTIGSAGPAGGAPSPLAEAALACFDVEAAATAQHPPARCCPPRPTRTASPPSSGTGAAPSIPSGSTRRWRT
ncbi:hypothetical protein GCM10010254_00840 [Streptomyces chromofuscus]|nr:hypothetical protein GCM10010254_00840 [Streptomyces chromofuscus]